LKRTEQNRSRLFGALACLSAVVFLYVPMAAAAWSSHAMPCCTNGFCNIPKHHHQKAPASTAPGEDCGHDMAGHDMSSMMKCSMSCCQDPDKPVITAVAFVRPPLIFVSLADIATRAIDRLRALEIPRPIEPPSPPPRVIVAAL
jgi:hypothetical protein